MKKLREFFSCSGLILPLVWLLFCILVVLGFAVAIAAELHLLKWMLP